MRPKNLAEIWNAEVIYDELRWFSEYPFEERSDQDLNELKRDLSESIESLTTWTNRSLLPQRRNRIRAIKRKLIDFRAQVVQEIQNREQRDQRQERLMNLTEPITRDTSNLPHPYGLQHPLKGSDYYKTIPPIFAPRPKIRGLL